MYNSSRSLEVLETVQSKHNQINYQKWRRKSYTRAQRFTNTISSKVKWGHIPKLKQQEEESPL